MNKRLQFEMSNGTTLEVDCDVAAQWIAELIADAGRYQWILQNDPEEFLSDATGINCWQFENKAEYDAAIDKARKQQEAAEAAARG